MRFKKKKNTLKDLLLPHPWKLDYICKNKWFCLLMSDGLVGFWGGIYVTGDSYEISQ